MVRNSIYSMVPVAEITTLNWEQMEAIESDGQLMGYKIPFNNNTSTSYSFILANFKNNEVGTLYKNQITYAPIHGGAYPVAIFNYNYATHESTEYDTKKPIEKVSVKMGMMRPMSLMSVDLQFPAVTTCGDFDQENGSQTSNLAHINTYILGFLLGFSEKGANTSKAKQRPTLTYYNPLPTIDQPKEKKAIIEWDILQ